MQKLRLLSIASFSLAIVSHGQVAGTEDEEEVFVLSPFEVTTTENAGYNVETSLAGNRLRTELRDIGSAVSVVTQEFMKDVGAQDNASLLQYMPSSEVAGVRGNFGGVGNGSALIEDTITPNQNTRVRGLSSADNTRDFFRSDMPWDSYNVDRVDLQRGPNSILFGQGSPAGIINTGLKGALYHDDSAVEFKLGSYGTFRVTGDFNRELIDDELAFRIIALHDDEKYKQDPAFNEDERLFMALRYEPKFLRKNGNRTIIKANYEVGEINSNNPRILPPEDAMTRWFTELGQETYNGFAVFDHLSGRPGHGQFRRSLAATGAPNPAFVPGLATFAIPSPRAGPAVFSSNGSQDIRIVDILRALNRDVNGDGSIFADNGWVSLKPTTKWAADSGAPYSAAGLWKNDVITDPGIFNFYDQLIDGDTKREYQDFSVANFSLAQTFFNDKLGFALDYNNEEFESGRIALLGYGVQLQVDQMAVYSDGSPDIGLVDGGEPYSDGTPNPNAGKAFVSSSNNQNNSRDAERETKRATAFFTHDFARNSDNWFSRLLGEHTFTGLLSEESLDEDIRTWQRYGIFDPSFYDLVEPTVQRFNYGDSTPVQIVYLGDSLLGKQLGASNIPGISGNPVIASGMMNYFNNTWKHPLDPAAAGYVDPGSSWLNGFYLPGDQDFTQADNPANYVGWDTFPVSFVDANESQENKDRLTTRARLTYASTETEALVWQAKWLDQAIVTTYGWRRDKALAAGHEISPNEIPEGQASGYGVIDLSPDSYRLQDSDYGDEIEVQSRSYSVVAHLNELPLIKGMTKGLPFNISAYYNQSTNFKPDASRFDIYGEPHPLPSGKTIDRGIRLETKDRRYSMRINKYETTNSATNSTQIQSYSIGAWMSLLQNYTNWYDYNIAAWSLAGAENAPIGDDFDVAWDSANNVGPINAMRYNLHHFLNDADGTPREFSEGTRTFIGQFAVDPVVERAIIANVREFQRGVDPRFYDAWKIDTFGDFGFPTGSVSYAVPVGFTIIEDTVSTGYEVEFSAEPLRNWRITANLSQSEARRVNIGGPNINEFMSHINANLGSSADWDMDNWDSTAVGRMQFFWGSPDVLRAGASWYSGEGIGAAPGSEWRLAQLVENTVVAELREWRFNLVTNYSFTDGPLKGFNIGGSMRYQSDITLTYMPTGNPNEALEAGYDFDDPIKGPSETNFDLWIGHRRQLTDRVEWVIQLNIFNVFQGGDELIPISAQPTGAYAGYRIAPTRTWSITNTFNF